MTRISEKVRDIVEVRPYTTVDDLFREPETTLTNYHFTDVTAYMMASWFDSVVSGDATQLGRAIAGFRGVGKSHFLATFAVLLSHPELRSRLTDQHVQSAVQRLPRRHFPVINLRRGMGGSLVHELKNAVSKTFDLDPATLGSTVSHLLKNVSEISGGLTPIIVIDSSPERNGPIERNDGDALAEIAEASKQASVFVGLALDDEIAMADGSNAAISRSYNIEYLEPENLHKIVNANIFPKNPRTQMLLGSLYEAFRESIPDFKWSEQRFSSLYPLHPILLDLTPFIRSYLPKFALFGFASAAGERILGRPADSLIGIDDVFDAVEFDLRKVPDLQTVFEAYDGLAAQIGSTVPVAARHKAKLVLKVLFLTSLAQRASTAGDISAAMMIIDDGEPGNSIRDIDSMLNGYAAARPDVLVVESTEAGRTRYRFKIGSSEYEKRLNRSIGAADPAEADRVLALGVADRFPELYDLLFGKRKTVELLIEWRGSMRRGRISIGFEPTSGGGSTAHLDWEIVLDLLGSDTKEAAFATGGTRIEWKTSPLLEDERRSLIAHAALTADSELRSDFPDEFSASMLSVSNALTAAVQRLMIDDARLVIDGFDYNFSENARTAPSLSKVIGEMLEPLFEALYPEHPYFVESLTSDVVEKFVLGLSESEGRPDQSAMTFGVALDVAEFGDSGFAVLPKEKLAEAAYASAVLEVIGERGEADLEAIHTRLSGSPVGLTIEAVRLILSAMAHRGLIELITKEKERVTGRSIDLKLDWSNIVSATSPKNIKISDSDLLEWARLVCSDTSISSLSDAADRAQILEAFVEISSQWERRNPFAAFEAVPDCDLDTRIWRHSNRTWEAYTSMVGDVNETLIGDITIEESLDRICGNFLARPAIFQRSRNSITAIEDFATARPEIDRIGNYLALAETTDVNEVEAARTRLRGALQLAMHSPSEQSLREVGYCWDKFLRLYSEFYADMHKMLAKPTDFRRFLEDTLGTSPAEALAQLQDHRQRPTLRAIKRRLAAYHCPLDPEPFLKANPFCKCGFQISAHSFLEELRDELRSLLSNVAA